MSGCMCGRRGDGGPLFIPVYLGASAWAWVRGEGAYRGNVFEREAYGEGGVKGD